MKSQSRLRRFTNVLVVLSLLPSAAAAVLWAITFRTPPSIRLNTRLGRSELIARDGRLQFDNKPQRDLEFEQGPEKKTGHH